MKNILCILLLSLCVSAFAESFDPLWQKAMAISKKSNRYVPGKTLYHSDMKNPKNAEDNMIIDVELKHQRKNKNEIETDIISAKKNHQIMKEDERKEVEKIAQQDFKPKNKGIFLTDDPKKIKVKALNQNKSINGILCKGFDFEYKTEDEKGKDQVYKGIAWLHAENGAPILLQFSFKKLPMFVKSLNIDNYFSFNQATMTSVSSMVKTSVEASFLGKKISNITELRFFDHWEF